MADPTTVQDPYAADDTDSLLGEGSDSQGMPDDAGSSQVITRSGSRAPNSDRYRAAVSNMKSLRDQYATVSGQEADAYAQQRETLQKATERLMSLQAGPTQDELHARLAAALTGGGGQGATIARVGQTNADFLKERRESEAAKASLLATYAQQGTTAQLGQANAQESKIATLMRLGQSDLNNSSNSLTKSTEDKVPTSMPQVIPDGNGGVKPNPEYIKFMANLAGARTAATTAARNGPEELTDDEKRIGDQIVAGELPPMPMSQRNPRAMRINAYADRVSKDGGGNGVSSIGYKMRQDAYKAFGAGSQGNKVRSMDVSVSHMNTLEGLINAVQNHDYTALNHWGNIFASQTGNPAPAEFDAAADIVSKELVAGIVQGGGVGPERERAAESLSKDHAPQTLRGVLAIYKHLLGGQLNGLQNQYVSTMYRNPTPDQTKKAVEEFRRKLNGTTLTQLLGAQVAPVPTGTKPKSRFTPEQQKVLDMYPQSTN